MAIPVVTLRGDDGERKTLRVHRLVALLFVPNPDSKPEVNHKFGDKTDNHFERLEWATHAENIQHAWDTGLLKSTASRSRNISDANVGRVGAKNAVSRPVELVNTGEIFESGCLAAKAYGIDQGRVSRCCNNKYGYKSAGRHPVTGEPLVWRFVQEEPHDRLPSEG
jgi:hypothetical protein